MKYKLAGIISFACIVIFAFVVSFFMADDNVKERVHHHLSAKEKAQCNAHIEGEFCSHLPIVAIETGGKYIPGEVTDKTDRFNGRIYTLAADGEETETVSVKVFDNNEQNNHLTDIPSIQTDTLIRKRGHSSRHFEKAQYVLHFVDNEGLEKQLEVMGMASHEEWVLYGPYLDKSLIRNYMFYNISGEIMEYAPNVRYCELFLDGEYRGIYLMCEGIVNGDGNRIDLTFTEMNSTLTGYLLRLDRPVESELSLVREIYTMSERHGYDDHNFIIKYPGQTKLTKEMAKQIELEISQFDKVMYSYDYDSEKFGYKNYIDTDSFVDYFIINEFTKNLDAGAYSTYIYKKPTEKYKMCVWDFNNSCDNYPSDWVGFTGFSMHDKLYFTPLCRDEEFVEAVIERYRELRKTVLSEEYLLNYIDETVDFLGDAYQRNEERWSNYIKSATYLQEGRPNAYTQQEATEQLKSWIVNRGNWLDKNIDTLRQYSAESKVKKYNEVTE